MTDMMWQIVVMLADTVWLVWLCGSAFNFLVRIFRPLRERRTQRRVVSELRPFALPALFVYEADYLFHHHGWWPKASFALNLLSWWVWYRDGDDDDRWRRRRAKLTERVRQVGHRLVVAEVGS